ADVLLRRLTLVRDADVQGVRRRGGDGRRDARGQCGAVEGRAHDPGPVDAAHRARGPGDTDAGENTADGARAKPSLRVRQEHVRGRLLVDPLVRQRVVDLKLRAAV